MSTCNNSATNICIRRIDRYVRVLCVYVCVCVGVRARCVDAVLAITQHGLPPIQYLLILSSRTDTHTYTRGDTRTAAPLHTHTHTHTYTDI